MALFSIIAFSSTGALLVYHSQYAKLVQVAARAATPNSVVDQTALLLMAILLAPLGFLECAYGLQSMFRKVTFQEMVLMAGIQILSLFVLFMDSPSSMIIADFSLFQFAEHSVFSTLPLDMMALTAMFITDSYYRWMPAYSSAIDWLVTSK